MAFNYLHPTLPNGSVILGLIDDNEEFQTYVYSSLAEFNEEWEGYDEAAEKEAIAVLKQLCEVIDKINANMSKLCGNRKEEE